jgi:sugar phosphate permease
VLNSYFDKRLGFAYSVANVGGSIGSLVMPIIIQNLLEEYGLQGALLVISGLILNTAIVGSLMRPFPNKENILNPVRAEKEPLVDEFDRFDSTNPYKDNVIVLAH